MPKQVRSTYTITFTHVNSVPLTHLLFAHVAILLTFACSEPEVHLPTHSSLHNKLPSESLQEETVPLIAPPIIDIGFEVPSSSLEVQPQNGDSQVYHFYNEDGEKHDIPSQGDQVSIWLSGSQPFRGNRSLGMRVRESQGVKDRIELRPVHGTTDSYALSYGQTKWFGYAFKFHKNSDIPTGWVHIAQMWQRPYPGRLSDFQVVPMTVSLKKNAETLQMYVSLRNGVDPTVIATRPNETLRTQSSNNIIDVPQGVWNTMIYQLTPSHVDDDRVGNIQVYLNDQLVVDHDGDYGAVPGETTGRQETFDLRVGIYREAQPTETIMFVDEVKYGDSKAAVTPGL